MRSRSGFFNDHFITRLQLSLVVKEFGKSVNIWLSYGRQYVLYMYVKSVKIVKTLAASRVWPIGLRL